MVYRGTCRDLRQLFGRPRPEFHMPSHPSERERVPGDRESRLSFLLKGKTKELINPYAINQMFELDFSDHENSGRHGLSKEDRRFLEIVEQGIHQCEDGHYELQLPLKTERICLITERQLSAHLIT